jgi:hypothetical protein
MKTYQYQILRFLPDRVTGEFINLGIVVYEPQSKFIKGKFFQKITRASSLFPTVNSRYLASTLKHLQKEFDNLSIRFNSELYFDKYNSIQAITSSILPIDDSSLFFTESKKGLDIDINISLNCLFDKIVMRYVDETEKEQLSDKDVWSKIYKRYFDELGLSKHLKEHTIKTELDNWKFEKAWKNGVWNCFESISFDLVKEESIKDKVYKWAGRIDELQSSKEPFNLYLLSKLPTQHRKMKSFINKKIGKIQFANNVKIELIFEDKVEIVVGEIKQKIDKHEDQ